MIFESKDGRFDRMTFALKGVVRDAGVVGDITEIENRYWPPSAEFDSVRSPWIAVATPHGELVVGRRKRVISIRWDGCKVMPHGEEVVADSRITHGETYCHAYGLQQTVECLKRLFGRAVSSEQSQLPDPREIPIPKLSEDAALALRASRVGLPVDGSVSSMSNERWKAAMRELRELPPGDLARLIREQKADVQ